MFQVGWVDFGLLGRQRPRIGSQNPGIERGHCRLFKKKAQDFDSFKKSGKAKTNQNVQPHSEKSPKTINHNNTYNTYYSAEGEIRTPASIVWKIR